MNTPMYERDHETLTDRLIAARELHPEREALVCYQNEGKQVRRLTYDQLYVRAMEIARGLSARGIEHGDHVVVWLPNSIEWALFQQATAMLGAVLVPANSFYKKSEFEYLLEQSDAVALVYTPRFLDLDYEQTLQSLMPELAEDAAEGGFQKFPKLRAVLCLGDPSLAGAETLGELVDAGRAVSEDAVLESARRVKPSDTLMIMYTSGTTGAPKGCVLSHANLLENAWHFGEAMDLDDHSRYLMPVPFFHNGGSVLGLLCALQKGSTLISMDRFIPTLALQILADERATHMGGVPTIYITLLHDATLPTWDLSALRMGFMAGAPCPVDTCKAVEEAFGLTVIVGLGMTESSPVITISTKDDPFVQRVSSVGRPTGCEVKVIDPYSQLEVEPGVDGELCTRGPNVMQGYYRMPEATANAIDQDGWLHTGDMVRLDEDGYYYVTGRLKDLYIVGGENVAPAEVEAVMRTHPAVEDASLVGVPDEKYGEVGLAVIKLKQGSVATESELIAHSRRSLASYKVPRYVQFVPEFPLTPAGKIKKFVLRDQYIDELRITGQ
ncbi:MULTISPECIES: AMP-binding protein [Rhodococcus]|uniref:AMP-binding protein n=1 Tax=Rhodococcus TaxID=1827 RepID=UPI00101F67C8|nr:MULTISPECIES: AMP-binding protein [Rhodococcus]UTT51109.1 AMP-binding protein [Rhodococcus gordoniae]